MATTDISVTNIVIASESDRRMSGISNLRSTKTRQLRKNHLTDVSVCSNSSNGQKTTNSFANGKISKRSNRDSIQPTAAAKASKSDY